MAAIVGVLVAIGAAIAMLFRRRTRSGEAEASVRGDKPGRSRTT
jgi:hypothetical protein